MHKYSNSAAIISKSPANWLVDKAGQTKMLTIIVILQFPHVSNSLKKLKITYKLT